MKVYPECVPRYVQQASRGAQGALFVDDVLTGVVQAKVFVSLWEASERRRVDHRNRGGVRVAGGLLRG